MTDDARARRWRCAALLLSALLLSAPLVLLPAGATARVEGLKSAVVTSPRSGSVGQDAGTLTVLSPVAGDASVGAGRLVIASAVSGSARVGVGSATVTRAGRIAGNLQVDTGTAAVRGQVGGSVRVIRGRVRVSGVVGGAVRVHQGRARVNGRVRGPVAVGLGSVTLGQGARVGGPVTVGQGYVTRAPGARVPGGIRVGRRLSPRGVDAALGAGASVGILTRAFAPLRHLTFLPLGPFPATGFPVAYGSVWALTWLGIGLRLLATLGGWVLGVILLALFPGTMSGVDTTLRAETARSLVTGIVALVLFIPAMVALAITLVGVLLIPFLGLFYLAAGVFGTVAATRWVGQSLWMSLERRNSLHPALELGVGTVALFIAGLIPVVGALATGLVPLVGLGAVLLSRFGSHRPWFGHRQPA